MSQRGPEYFLNRELSWLNFNSRVLDEAGDQRNPLLERLKFVAIFSSNLDEFFMVRVAGLRQQLEAGSATADPAGMSPRRQLDTAQRRVRSLIRRQYRYLFEDILPALAEHGIRLFSCDELDERQNNSLGRYFEHQILPVLTPVAVDPSHPFPILANGTLEIVVRLRKPSSGETSRAFVEVPNVLPRFVDLDAAAEEGQRSVLLLEDLIIAHIQRLFEGCEVLEAVPFRVTRDMDFSLNEEEASDLLDHLEKQLRRRRRRAPVRLEIRRGAGRALVEWLRECLDLERGAVYRVPTMLDLTACFDLCDSEHHPELLEAPWPPVPSPLFPARESMFSIITRLGCAPLFVPYESFDPVIRFINEAADDPGVLAIKQTLYRVSGDSPVVRALQRAAENGKQVTVVVELKARFDEERNIAWARRLEESGAHVIYGILGLKVHTKALMVVRREEGLIRRYLHLATGNYNDKTAKLYTDTGVFTNDEHFCADAAALFNVMTGCSSPPRWRRLAVAPFDLRRRFLGLIDREARLSAPHAPGRILAKMNSLVDPEIIEHLYDAADAGVRIDLIVRGTCCLRPDLDKHDNIRVLSIVDRFLEHARIFRFHNGGDQEYYLASADWMPRNLDRRIETLFPVEDAETRRLIDSMLEFQLEDKAKGRRLTSDGHYTRCFRRSYAARSQRRTYELFVERRNDAESRSHSSELQVFRAPEEETR